MESFLSAPTSFLDALEKELIDSGMAEPEDGDDGAGALPAAMPAAKLAHACARLLARC